MTEIPVTCNVEPFRYQATPQPGADDGASGNQINEQALEDYLNRLRVAICEDLTEIFNSGDVILSFLQLTDTPDSYAGQEGKLVQVNAAENGLQFWPATFTAHAGQLVVVNGTEDGFDFIPQPDPPSTYYLTPRLISMCPPSVTTAFGPAWTASGAGQIQLPTNPSNALTANYRQSFSSGTGANAVAGIHMGVFQCIRGTAAPMGGFRLRWRFGVELYTSGARCWVGLHPVAASQPSGATEPSSNVNCIYLGFDSTDANWQIMHNDNAGTCTKINLGAGFAINTTSLLEITIEMEPSASEFTYTLRDLSLGTSTTGTPNSNLPVGGQPLKPCMQIGTAATGVANRISTIFCSLEVGPGE